MRFESATVPAAVMPDHASGVMMVLRNTCHCPAKKGMGRLLKTGISQKTCQTIKFKAFGKKSKESVTDSCLSSSRQHKTKDL